MVDKPNFCVVHIDPSPLFAVIVAQLFSLPQQPFFSGQRLCEYGNKADPSTPTTKYMMCHSYQSFDSKSPNWGSVYLKYSNHFFSYAKAQLQVEKQTSLI